MQFSQWRRRSSLTSCSRCRIRQLVCSRVLENLISASPHWAQMPCCTWACQVQPQYDDLLTSMIHWRRYSYAPHYPATYCVPVSPRALKNISFCMSHHLTYCLSTYGRWLSQSQLLAQWRVLTAKVSASTATLWHSLKTFLFSVYWCIQCISDFLQRCTT